MRKLLTFLSTKGVYILMVGCLILGFSSLYFKNATLDDGLYLFETTIMTEALQRGEWFGDYAVGTHGFLFKLPVAILFLLTGPSLSLATIWNILLATLSLFLFYKILEQLFPKRIYPFLGTFLMFCNFQFILNLPTYMREFPVIIGVLLLLYFIVKKKSYWLFGLASLLIFEGKEYVFFMFLPALILYILIVEWGGLNFKTLWKYIKSYVQILLPTTIFLLLMIFTSAVPLNMYALSVIPGITKGGVEFQTRHFNVDLATTNRIDEEAPSLQKIAQKEEPFLNKVWGAVVSYAGKILYPRTFSFISIPKVIYFPALLSSIILFPSFLRKKKRELLALSVILWSFTSIFILRASFDRYLFPILPVIIIFYLLFLSDVVKKRREFLCIIGVTGILTLLGLFFEVDYILIKILLNTLALSGYLFYFFSHGKFKQLHVLLISLIGILTFSVVAYFFWANGQIRKYILWGKDYEVEKVVKYFKLEEKIQINDPGWGMLLSVYKRDSMLTPEWKWELADWVPRKERLKVFEESTIYSPMGTSIRHDLETVRNSNVKKLALMISKLEEEVFPHEGKLELYREAEWLRLEEVVELKNKTLYIFEVISD